VQRATTRRGCDWGSVIHYGGGGGGGGVWWVWVGVGGGG